MPTVNITSASVYNAALKVTGELMPDKGVPITGYSIEVTTPDGKLIKMVINEPNSGGNFEYCGTTLDNAPISLPCVIKVVTNRQASASTEVTTYGDPLIGFLPAGSYQLTCRNIRTELTCKAADGKGNLQNAVLDLTKLVNPNLWNEYGKLKIDPVYQPQNGFLPGGSWIQSCQDVTVILHCEARKKDGKWIDASFDLTNLHQADLWNDEGELKNAL